MQSVVTGQAPINLQRKITSGEEQIKTQDNNTHNNLNKSYTSDKNKKVISAYHTYVYIILRTRTTYQDTYHMLNESQQKPKPRTQHSTRKKKTKIQDDQKPTMSKSKSKKEKEKEEKSNQSTSTTQERRQYARGIRILQARKEHGGGCGDETK